MGWYGQGSVSDSGLWARGTQTRLQRRSTMHWLHWAAVVSSLCLTFGAWYIAQSQADAAAQEEFDREADQVVELLVERMAHYEDGLVAGVGFLNGSSHDVSLAEWRAFADTLRLERRYPGINGIGVIYVSDRTSVPALEAELQATRPYFHVHPKHDREEHYPIVFIEPESMNRAAVGLDMAHEPNRRGAFEQARDTATPQITGPIVLVQDQGKTPGFLFFVPRYSQGQPPDTVAERRKGMVRVVYAAFVVKKLVNGLLSKDKRRVSIAIKDGEESIYEEATDSAHVPAYSRKEDLELYGRTWSITLRSTSRFDEAQSHSQPILILFGGLFIDALLLGLFITISRGSKQALDYAATATAELRGERERLQQSNHDLNRFAHVVAHDLNEPLRVVTAYTRLLRDEYAPNLNTEGAQVVERIVEGSLRMRALLRAVLEYSQYARNQAQLETVDLNTAVDQAIDNVAKLIEESGAEIRLEGRLPSVAGEPLLVLQVLQNLLQNAIKFRHEDRAPVVTVSATTEGASVLVHIVDNGIGIPDGDRDRVFDMFVRLHHRTDYPGSGAGLAIARRIMQSMGGNITIGPQREVGLEVLLTFAAANSRDSGV